MFKLYAQKHTRHYNAFICRDHQEVWPWFNTSSKETLNILLVANSTDYWERETFCRSSNLCYCGKYEMFFSSKCLQTPSFEWVTLFCWQFEMHIALQKGFVSEMNALSLLCCHLVAAESI